MLFAVSTRRGTSLTGRKRLQQSPSHTCSSAHEKPNNSKIRPAVLFSLHERRGESRTFRSAVSSEVGLHLLRFRGAEPRATNSTPTERVSSRLLPKLTRGHPRDHAVQISFFSL